MMVRVHGPKTQPTITSDPTNPTVTAHHIKVGTYAIRSLCKWGYFGPTESQYDQTT